MEQCMKRKDSSSDDSDEELENFPGDIISPYKRMKIHTHQNNSAEDIRKKVIMKKDGRKVKVLQNPGQLKLSVYMNFGHLTVHVMQGRNFSSKWQNLCDSYVKISLVPDDTRRTRCKTQSVMDTNNPTYDEKFSFELLEEDHNKRLLISVWHRDQPSRCADIICLHHRLSEFLGCMSFGVKHLLDPKKETSGWFYLLTEEIGRKKHLQVSKHKPTNQLKVRPHNNIPAINKDVWWMDPTTITLPRGKYGYGFSVIESCPVKVGRVDKASPAEDAGLCRGDCIIRINGQNVSRSTSDSVVKLLKQSTTTLTLDVQRPQKVAIETFDKSPWKPKPVPFHEQEPNDNRDYGIDVCDPASDDERSNENELSGDILSGSDHFDRYTTPLPLLCNAPESSPSCERRKQEAIHRLLSIELDFIDFMHCGMERYSRPLRHCIITQRQHLQLFQNVEKLVTISEYHIKQMQDNVSSCSDTDTSCSKSSNDTQNFVNSIGMIYQSKVQLLYQAYDTYARGMKDASCVLSDLKRNEDFIKFVSDVTVNPRQPPLTSFIYRPVQHIRHLYQTLRDIFECTSKDEPDYNKLKQVVEGLQECVMNITNYSCARTTSWDSLSTTSTSSGTSSQSCTSQSSAQSGTRTKVPSPSLVSVRSCDSEVQRIQDRLLVPPHIPAFNLCNEERHVIYTGEVYVWDGRIWLKNHLILFSDLLLQTDIDRHGNLRVLEHPLCLQDVQTVQAQREHMTEFVLRLDGSKVQSARHKLVLRAPTTELKYTWKALLEQRIVSCTGNMEVYSSGSINNSVATIIV